MVKKIISVCILFFLLFSFIPVIDSHPHPVMTLDNINGTINIRALHIQQITEQYVKDNFILKNCSYQLFEARSAMLETYITLKHNCKNVSIETNTLFEDFWGATPILKTTTGFVELNETENSSFIDDVKNMRIPSNSLLVIPFLFILGIIFTFSGDFFSYILPVSVSSKAKEDKKMWIKTWLIHILSTYFFVIFSLKFFSDYIVKFSGFVIIAAGGLMFLENRLQKKHLSPYLLALIPCAGSIFVATVIFSNNFFYMAITPFVMNLGDLIFLKIGSKIPFPKKHINKIPIIMLIIGIIVIVKLSAFSGAGMVFDSEPVVHKGNFVTITYSGRFEDASMYGDIAYQSASFKVGSGEMIWGIDNATRGMKKDEIKKVFMRPEWAYGLYNSSKIIEFPISNLNNKEKLIVGNYISLNHGNFSQDAKILEIKEDSVVLDANHFLAGKFLYYTIKIQKIGEE